MESILTSIKSLLGMQEDYTHFDPDIIIHINSAFFILEQAGVNPGVYFGIESSEEVWTDYMATNTNLQVIKSFIYLKVRLLFDPPLSGSLVELMKIQADELLWRIMISVDPKPIVIPIDTEEEYNGY